MFSSKAHLESHHAVRLVELSWSSPPAVLSHAFPGAILKKADRQHDLLLLARCDQEIFKLLVEVEPELLGPYRRMDARKAKLLELAGPVRNESQHVLE